MLDAARLLQMHQDEDPELPYDPGRDGFDFTTAEIETYISREQRRTDAWRAENAHLA